MNLIEIADALAEKYHENQKRRDGQPYITHPRAVEETAKRLYNPSESYGTPLPIGEELPVLQALCLMHDILEDCDATSIELAKKLKEHVSEDIVDFLMHMLYLLNKRNHPDYLSYIILVKLHPATNFVKRCDIDHNLIGCSGSLKDKYELAEYILTH